MMKEVDNNEQVSYYSVVCPHCLHKHLDPLEICTPDDFDWIVFECAGCGEEVKVCCEITIEWTTRKVLKNEY